MARTAFILGGGGQIGRAVAENLTRAGWTVRIGQRSDAELPPPLRAAGVQSVRVDRDNDDALRAALGEGADAVIDCVAFTADHGRQWRALQAGVGALVVISSASVYQDAKGRTLDEAAQTGFPNFGGPLTEAHQTVAPGPGTYSTQKIALERTLLDHAHIPVSVLRPCAIHGPGSTHPREWWFLKRALDGRRSVPLAFDGLSRFHTTATANIAEVCRLALEQPASRVLNVGDPDAPTTREIGDSIAHAVGHEWRVVEFPGPRKGGVGASPWSIPLPMLVSMTAAERLGYSPVVSHSAAMRALCADLRVAAEGRRWENAFPKLAAYPWPLFDYAAEDDVLRHL